MSYILDNKIEIKYTNAYKEKLMQNGLVYPVYFSLIDDEINYNLLNRFDGFSGNEGFENNTVSADLDNHILTTPILEPVERVYSKLYGYNDLQNITDIQLIGTETTDSQSEYSKFSKYYIDCQYIEKENKYYDNGKYIIKYKSANTYIDLFKLQCSNKLYLQDQSQQNTDSTDIIDSFVDGDIQNDYLLYKDLVANRYNSHKQLSDNKIIEISSKLDKTARGLLTIPVNSDYFPSHKIFLHIHSNTLFSTKILDVTDNGLQASKPINFNIFSFMQLMNSETVNVESFVDFTIFFETIVKFNIDGSSKILRAKTQPITIEIEL